MSHKRSRAHYEDSDDDEPTLGRQILPVANLPANFSDTPEDGLQYLFTVRRDARKLPHVTRVTNPYEKAAVAPPEPSTSKPTHHPSLPSPEWRHVLLNRFNNLRKYAFKAPTNVQLPESRLMPDRKERDQWWAFVSGKSEMEWNPPKKPPKQRRIKRTVAPEPVAEASSHEAAVEPLEEPDPVKLKPRILTPTLLQHIDERMALHILMYFAYWLNLHLDQDEKPFPRLADAHAQWIFFLLTRVDDYVSADDMAMLRSLVRGCLGLLKVMHREEGREDESIMEESCWIIISTVIGVWGQQDLWMDAEEMLRSLE